MLVSYLYVDSTTFSRTTIPKTFHCFRYALGETIEVTFRSVSESSRWCVGGWGSTWERATE